MANSKYTQTLVVIGGGAAGFFCAINAAEQNPDLKVVLLEKTSKLLSKVKVSGGGRCNVTHACFSIAEMVKKYPRGANFLKKAFHHFFTQDTIDWFAAKGVPLKTESDGRMFPDSNTSQTIIDCFLHQAQLHNIAVHVSTEVQQLTNTNQQFELLLKNGAVITADYVTIACGGYAKSELYHWLTQTGHSVVAPVPSLFTFNLPKHPITELMGLSVPDAQVKIVGTKLKEQGPVLITHWGLSGPAVLRLSAWGALALKELNWHHTIQINWIPQWNEEQLRQQIGALRQQLAGQKLYNKNPFELPARLWSFILAEAQIGEETRWADLPAKQQNLLIKYLCAYELAVKGKTTFKEEFVTAGGVELSEIDHSTMQSKKVRNLFFAGEILNIDGVTGGFNFQNAWTTAFIAAKAIATESKPNMANEVIVN